MSIILPQVPFHNSSCDGTQVHKTAKQQVRPSPALHTVILTRLTSIYEYTYLSVHKQIYEHMYIYICIKNYFTQIKNNISLTFGDVSIQKGRIWTNHFSIQDVPQRLVGISMPKTYRILIGMFKTYSNNPNPCCHTSFLYHKHYHLYSNKYYMLYESEKRVFWCLVLAKVSSIHSTPTFVCPKFTYGSSRYPVVSRLVVDVHPVETC